MPARPRAARPVRCSRRRWRHRSDRRRYRCAAARSAWPTTCSACGAQARLVAADLAGEHPWWDGQRFDRILLDAPCSAVGVIRRHPDIKLLRRPQDIGTLAALQRRLLEQCLTLLQPGGRLLYSTCSVLPAENDAVVEAVLAAVPAARSVPVASQPLLPAMLPPDIRTCSHGVQLLPGNAALTDGFYYACLTIA